MRTTLPKQLQSYKAGYAIPVTGEVILTAPLAAGMVDGIPAMDGATVLSVMVHALLNALPAKEQSTVNLRLQRD